MKKLPAIYGCLVLFTVAVLFLGSTEELCAEPGQKLVEGRDWTSPSTGMEFVWIEQMGMWVGKYEVTNAEYRKKEPQHESRDFGGYTLNLDRQPVVYVNFSDGKSYAGWMTEKDRDVLPQGYGYRLPTEIEWMRYAQCGDGREYPWGDDWPPVSGRAGNYRDSTAAKELNLSNPIPEYDDGFPVTAPVDELWVNPWRLAGAGGNVWEMCVSDRNPESFGSWRGGSWDIFNPDFLRCTNRLSIGESYRFYSYGFRLVLSR